MISPLFRKQSKKVSYALFFLGDRLGIHLLPKHYYTPVPDYSWLRANTPVWDSPYPMTGIHWDLDEQLNWLTPMVQRYQHEVAGLKRYHSYKPWGPGYGSIEYQVLHSFVRKYKPSRIIEIGSGVTTRIMLDAIEQNENEDEAFSQLTCIEPYPSSYLQNTRNIALTTSKCQEVSLDLFGTLQSGDLLFVDSSHTVAVGSDVNRIILDILPTLAPGVWVHIHDIFFPYLYAPTVMNDYFGWQETAMLAAALQNNRSLRIACSLSGLHYGRRDSLTALLPDYRPSQVHYQATSDLGHNGHYPTSIWLSVDTQ